MEFEFATAVIFPHAVTYKNQTIPCEQMHGGRGSSAVERATPGEEVPGSIRAVAARSLQVGSVSV